MIRATLHEEIGRGSSDCSYGEQGQEGYYVHPAS
jgi:hypothetical protein